MLGMMVIYFSIKKTKWADKAIILSLSLLWLWMGIVYHLLFFTSINKAAYLFGALNILQAAAFLFWGLFRGALSFKFHSNLYGWTGVVLLAYALVIYPILSYGLGHIYPSSPTFGLPCPTTIFTFGLLLWTDKKLPLVVFIIPFLWSIVGFSAALSLGIKEDTGLLISGLVSVSLILIRDHTRLYPGSIVDEV